MIKNTLLSCISALFIALLPLNYALSSELQHHSTFSYSELNKPLFIGELHAPAGPLDADALLAGEQPFTMQVLVETRSFSQRRFKKLWLEGVAINNSYEKLQANNKYLAKFSNLFKDRLLSGDDFQVRYTDKKTTVIKLNGITLATFPYSDFGPVLLSSWLGDVPLSSSTKAHILQSGIDPDANSRKGALTYTKTRQVTVQSWLNPADAIAMTPAPSVKAVSVDVAESIISTVKKPDAAKIAIKPTNKQPAKSKPTVQVAAKNTVKSTIKPVVAAIPKPARTSTPTSTRTPTPTPTSTSTSTSTPPKAVKSPLPIKPPAKIAKIIAPAELPTSKPEPTATDDTLEEEVEIEAEETEELLALRQTYYQALIKHLQNFKTIPFQAFQRRWTGEVRLYIVIDKAGNVLSHRFLKEDRRKVFNVQAADALKRATPFPAIPAELHEKEFSFSVPLQYNLN
jgi:TonB family protein